MNDDICNWYRKFGDSIIPLHMYYLHTWTRIYWPEPVLKIKMAHSLRWLWKIKSFIIHVHWTNFFCRKRLSWGSLLAHGLARVHDFCFAQLHILLLRKNRFSWKTSAHACYAGLLPHEHQDCQFFSARLDCSVDKTKKCSLKPSVAICYLDR